MVGHASVKVLHTALTYDFRPHGSLGPLANSAPTWYVTTPLTCGHGSAG